MGRFLKPAVLGSEREFEKHFGESENFEEFEKVSENLAALPPYAIHGNGQKI